MSRNKHPYPRLSFGRLMAMIIKEFIQVRRDRMTFAMMMGIPLMQLVLFGFAINADPKGLPTAVLAADHGQFDRSLIAAMQASSYFRIVDTADSEAEAERMLAMGMVQFVVSVPSGFSRDVARGDRPPLLVEADATDPAATSNALAALQMLAHNALDRDLKGALADLKSGPPPFELRVHRRYNQEGVSQFNIVPGLMGVVLTMTMTVMTSIAVTRERERGTMENLLVMPLRPIEVMIGKIVPYIVIGYVQVALILLAAKVIFGVPMVGSLFLLTMCIVVFIAANLAFGFTFSTIAGNQLQAMQMSFFYFLPSILLSGFMFPYRGMPGWAQTLGEVLPLTHFLRIVRGIMLKGNGVAEVAPEVGALFIILAAAGVLAMKRYRETLD
ncbi:MAG: mannose-1-phosphate guanyltransferase [Rhodospirillales bacterium RIFCSPLOWO2_12_FULL_58_28]|nr:MAG: mannose-1-phosphate guanyltransferase [Rhodospirillales bacterium RIFCSPLOWO2_02_FULL_58_16]OHC78034.1 MAG: mannose-1-phosphate guanyltransferase [Rhodospirillales bacterium RIFCSPLOWO2_12_FULL_58_28]